MNSVSSRNVLCQISKFVCNEVVMKSTKLPTSTVQDSSICFWIFCVKISLKLKALRCVFSKRSSRQIETQAKSYWTRFYGTMKVMQLVSSQIGVPPSAYWSVFCGSKCGSEDLYFVMLSVTSLLDQNDPHLRRVFRGYVTS